MTNRNEYVRNWCKENPLQRRKHLLKYYYKNRAIINLLFSKPSSSQKDIGDKYLEEHYGKTWV